ncbi:MAG: DNA-binding protein [Planctomycetota bacterium]
MLNQQLDTWLWWDEERQWFKLYGSKFTEQELAAGVYPNQAKAVAEVRRLPYLALSAEVRACVQTYLDEDLVPANKPGDAFHLALATLYMVNYLLTWNHAHLANDQTREKLERVNRAKGWWTPLIVSPKTIPKVALGQSVRRRHED